MTKARTAVVAGTAALLITGCGSSSSGGSSNRLFNPALVPRSERLRHKHYALVPATAITRAAYLSGAASGYRFAMTMREYVPSVARTITITGTGSYSVPDRAGSMTMSIAVPADAAAALGNNLQIRTVFSRTSAYMRMPAAIASRIPGGKPWWKLDVSAAMSRAGVHGISSLLNSTSSLNTDPGRYLSYLRALSAGRVADLGPATVDGFNATQYRGTLDYGRLGKALPATSRAAAAELATLMRRLTGATTSPFKVWIDSSRRVRRLVTDTAAQIPGGTHLRVQMQMDFLAYGPQPAPTLPPAGETVDLMTMIHGKL